MQLIELPAISVEASHSLARCRLSACVGVPVGAERAIAVDEVGFGLDGPALTVKGFAQSAGGPRRAPFRYVGASGPVHRGHEDSFSVLQLIGAQQRLTQIVLRGRRVWMVGGDDLQERGDRRSQLRLGVGVLLAFDLYGTQRGAVVRRPPVIQSLRSDLGLQRLMSELLRLDQVMLRPPHFRERIEDVRNGTTVVAVNRTVRAQSVLQQDGSFVQTTQTTQRFAELRLRTRPIGMQRGEDRGVDFYGSTGVALGSDEIVLPDEGSRLVYQQRCRLWIAPEFEVPEQCERLVVKGLRRVGLAQFHLRATAICNHSSVDCRMLLVEPLQDVF